MLNYRAVFTSFCLILLFLCGNVLQAADGKISKIFHTSNDVDREAVVFHLNGPFMPKVFALKGVNPRVVFDFFNTSLARSVPIAITTKGSMVQKIRTGRHSNKTRVVLDLAPGGSFNFEQQFDKEKNILTIELYSAAVPVIETPQAGKEPDIVAEHEPVLPPSTAVVEVLEPVETVSDVFVAEEIVEEEIPIVAEETSVELEPVLTDITFEDTSNKGEMVIFKLNGFYPPEVHGEEDGTPKVTCVFRETNLGGKVLKKRVIQGKFVHSISVQPPVDSGQLKVILELVPGKNYDLQQVFFKEDNLFVIIINSYDANMSKK